MVCGFCGTHVEDGFTVCSGCGAEYRIANPIRSIFGIFVLLMVVLLPLSLAAGYAVLEVAGDGVFGEILSGVVNWVGLGISCWVVYRLARRMFVKRWYRRMDT